MHDDGVKILLFLAQGFEDLEAVAIMDVFGWTHYREHLRKAYVTTVGLRDVVQSRFGLAIKPDLRLSEVSPYRGGFTVTATRRPMIPPSIESRVEFTKEAAI